MWFLILNHGDWPTVSLKFPRLSMSLFFLMEINVTLINVSLIAAYKDIHFFSSVDNIKDVIKDLVLLISVSSVQSLSHVQLFATPWITACQASLSITNSWSSLRFTSIESVMLSSHLILCCPLLLLPPVPPSISLFQWVNSSHEVAKVLEFQL